MPRLLSTDRLSGNTDRLKVALAFLHTFVNLPTLYYGTEQGFNGANDPLNREDMFDGEYEFGPSSGDTFNYLHDLFLYIRHLNLLRQAYPVLISGNFNERWQSFSGSGLYVFSRVIGTDEVIVALNTSSSAQTAINAGSGPSTAQTNGTELVNLLDMSESLIVGNGGAANKITFTVPGYGVKIFTPRSQVQTLPPTITDVQPGHLVGNTVLSSSIQMNFDRPMDTTSVTAAFSTTPALTGTFAWASNNTFAIFTPDSLLSSNTAYQIEIAGTATATNGFALGDRYESTFTTGDVAEEDMTLGHYVLDGVLDPDAVLIATNGGIPLYVAYDTTNHALYVATVDAGEGNDHFIFLDDTLDGSTQPIPSWNKNGTVAWDGPFLADENDNEFASWLNVQASASAATGPNGGVLEGVINLDEQYGVLPTYIHLSVGLYGTLDASTLISSLQVPASHNQDQNIDSNEFARYTLLTGEVLIEVPPFNPQEVPLTQYTIDGQFSAGEEAHLKMSNGIQKLYVDFNGSILYTATQDAGEGSDHFIQVTDHPEGSLSAPWAKSGEHHGSKAFPRR